MDFDSRLFGNVKERFIKGYQILSSLNCKVPEELLRLQELMASETPNASECVKLIEQYPDITGELIYRSNLACESESKTFNSLSQIVQVFGLYPLYTMYSALLLEDNFTQSSAEKEIVHHSRGVAIAASQLAYWVYDLTPIEAYSLGMMHNVGALYMSRLSQEYYVEFAEQYAKPVDAHRLELDKWGTSHAFVGAIVAKKWGVSRVGIKSILFHHDFECLLKTQKTSKIRETTSVIMAANYLVNSFTNDDFVTPELLGYRDLSKQGLDQVPDQAFKAAKASLIKHF